MNPSEVGVLTGILASLVTILVYLIRGTRDAREAAYHSQQANAAVNGRGPGEHKLYDLVAHIEERQKAQTEDLQVLIEGKLDFDRRGWPSLPPGLSTAAELTSTIDGLRHHDERVDEKLDAILQELRAHVQWEEAQKYPH
jgi:hypothetical protein